MRAMEVGDFAIQLESNSRTAAFDDARADSHK
jgi:hypothetical protein